MAAGTKTAKNRTTSKRNVAPKGRSKQAGGGGANSRQNGRGATATAAKSKSAARESARPSARATRRGANSPATKRGAPHKAATPGSDTDRGAARERGPKSKAAMAGSAKGTDARFLKKHEGNLSSSTQRAHWISKPGEERGRDGQTLATRSHEVIQRWAEERGGVPATVPTKRTTDRPRVLRIDFPDYSKKRLEKISWNDWFRTFDQRDLVFLFQETTKDGTQSNFFRLDSPHREEG